MAGRCSRGQHGAATGWMNYTIEPVERACSSLSYCGYWTCAAARRRGLLAVGSPRIADRFGPSHDIVVREGKGLTKRCRADGTLLLVLVSGVCQGSAGSINWLYPGLPRQLRQLAVMDGGAGVGWAGHACARRAGRRAGACLMSTCGGSGEQVHGPTHQRTFGGACLQVRRCGGASSASKAQLAGPWRARPSAPGVAAQPCLHPL